MMQYGFFWQNKQKKREFQMMKNFLNIHFVDLLKQRKT